MIGNIHDLRDHFHYYVLILSTVVLGLFTFRIVEQLSYSHKCRKPEQKQKIRLDRPFSPHGNLYFICIKIMNLLMKSHFSMICPHL